MEATYLGDIALTDETLEHYGVKGMKWGRRRNNKIKPIKNKRNKQGYRTDTPLTNLITSIGGKVGDDTRKKDNAVGRFMNYMDKPIGAMRVEAASANDTDSEEYWQMGEDGKWHKYKGGKRVK